MTADLKRFMQSSDFKPVSAHDGDHQIVMAISGHEGSGKTSLALTAPGPIAYINIDKGLHRAFKPANKELVKCEIEVPREIGRKSPEKLKQEAQAEITKFHKNYQAALADPNIRSIVIDNSTSLNELVLVSHFGKLQQIPQNLRGLPNLDMQQIVRSPIADPKCTKVVIHIVQLKKQYKGDEWNGKDWELAGYNKMAYLVDAVIEMRKDDKKRLLKAVVQKPALELEKMGAEYVIASYDGDEDALDTMGYDAFPFIASELTRTDPEDWFDK